jgi:hypothetical protein
LNFPSQRNLFRLAWQWVYENQVLTEKRLKQRSAADPRFGGRVLLHDAGTLVYFRELRAFDLPGLCSQPGFRMSRYYLADPRLVAEGLERIDPSLWPDLAIVCRQFGRYPWVSEPLMLRDASESDDRFKKNWHEVYRVPKELLRRGHVLPESQVDLGWKVVIDWMSGICSVNRNMVSEFTGRDMVLSRRPCSVLMTLRGGNYWTAVGG